MSSESYWETVSPDPDAAIGPPVTEEDIQEWEQRRGIILPEFLKRAYTQQSGGYIRGTEICIVPLYWVQPVEPGYVDDFMDAADRSRFDPARLFYLGGDGDGSTLLLHWEAGADQEPAVYGHWTDGGTVERRAGSVDALVAARLK